MKNLNKEELMDISLKGLVDMVLNDDKLNKSQKISLLSERKINMYWDLKYKVLNKQVKSDMKICIQYINEELNKLKKDKTIN